MPEGPEVTIVTKQLNSAVQNKTIKDIEIVSGRYLRKEPVGFTDYVDYAVNQFPQQVLGVNNKGKFIYWLTTTGVIFSTLGMTGTYKTENNKGIFLGQKKRYEHTEICMISWGVVIMFSTV